MIFFLKVLVSSFAALITGYILPGVHVRDFITAVVVAFVLGLLNMLLKPILILLTIPITILTLGLFLLVINGFIILIATHIVKGFVVDGFWWAVLFSIILTIVTWLLEIPVKSA